MLRSKNLLTSNFPISQSPTHKSFLSHPTLPSSLLPFLCRPITIFSISSQSRSRVEPWLAQVAEPTNPIITSVPDEGPIELPPSPPTIFATTDDPSPLQVTTSVFLTGAISIFLFRAVRRRAKRAKELKFRSSGAKESLKDEALQRLKEISTGPVESKSEPSAIQTFLGAIAAGVIALILYKFTTTIEAALNRQTMSDSFSVRQITITIRTIINGICYLATFVFGINSVGLFLYSGQLAINSLMEGSTNKEAENSGDGQLSSSNSTAESTSDNTELSSTQSDQNPNDLQ